MYRFNAIPTEIPMAFSFSFIFPPRNEKANPKIYMELQGAQNSHNNIKKKSDSHFAKLLLENVLIQQHNPDSVAYTSTMTSGTALRVQRYICILRSTDFQQRHQDWGKKHLQQMVLAAHTHIQTSTHTRCKRATRLGQWRQVCEPSRKDGSACMTAEPRLAQPEYTAGQGQHRRRQAQVTMTTDTHAEVVNKCSQAESIVYWIGIPHHDQGELYSQSTRKSALTYVWH